MSRGLSKRDLITSQAALVYTHATARQEMTKCVVIYLLESRIQELQQTLAIGVPFQVCGVLMHFQLDLHRYGHGLVPAC